MFKSKKGVIPSIDMFLAVFIFLMILVLIIFTWNRYVFALDEQAAFSRMQYKALQISDLLIKSPGFPQSWEENLSGIEVLGLAESDHLLSPAKLNNFIGLNYSRIKNLLKTSPYEFSFALQTLESITLEEIGQPFNGTRQVNIERNILYNGEKRKIKFILWE